MRLEIDRALGDDLLWVAAGPNYRRPNVSAANLSSTRATGPSTIRIAGRHKNAPVEWSRQEGIYRLARRRPGSRSARDELFHDDQSGWGIYIPTSSLCAL